MINGAVSGILSDELKKAKEAVGENKAAIDALVNELMEKTHLNGEEIDRILSGFAKRKPEKCT